MAISSLKNLIDGGEERVVGWYEQFDQKKTQEIDFGILFFVFLFEIIVIPFKVDEHQQNKE